MPVHTHTKKIEGAMTMTMTYDLCVVCVGVKQKSDAVAQKHSIAFKINI